MTRGGRRADSTDLTRRERQIMDVLYASSEATAAEVQEGMTGSPSYSTVRTLLRKLVEKGHVRYRQVGPRYVYAPVVGKPQASDSALRRVLDTFFDGSTGSLVVNLLGRSRGEISAEEIAAIEAELERLKGGGT